MSTSSHLGEICALLAPLAWSFAIILYRKTGLVVPPVVLNVFKNVVAILLFIATLAIIGEASPEGVSGRDYALLLVSGAIGVAISDLFFFLCLNRLGAGLQAIVNTSYSPSIILLSIVFLGEHLDGMQWVGVALILSAVLSVGWMRGATGERRPRAIFVGVCFGVVGTTTQAVSVVMVKPLLDGLSEASGGDVRLQLAALVWATCWRLLGGTAASFLLLPFTPRVGRALATLGDRSIWLVMVAGSVLGTFVSLLLWMAGFMWADASIAAALNQTSTLFTFVLAALLLKEPVTHLRIVGLVLGVVGVALVTL